MTREALFLLCTADLWPISPAPASNFSALASCIALPATSLQALPLDRRSPAISGYERTTPSSNPDRPDSIKTSLVDAGVMQPVCSLVITESCTQLN
jgi:hypothetical protein